MAANAQRIEKALLAKGLKATVTWTPIAKEGADSGITGYYSEQLAMTKYRTKGSQHFGYLPNSMGYSLKEALALVESIEEFAAPIDKNTAL